VLPRPLCAPSCLPPPAPPPPPNTSATVMTITTTTITIKLPTLPLVLLLLFSSPLKHHHFTITTSSNTITTITIIAKSPTLPPALLSLLSSPVPLTPSPRPTFRSPYDHLNSNSVSQAFLPISHSQSLPPLLSTSCKNNTGKGELLAHIAQLRDDFRAEHPDGSFRPRRRFGSSTVSHHLSNCQTVWYPIKAA
jgi:hypothetical protein